MKTPAVALALLITASLPIAINGECVDPPRKPRRDRVCYQRRAASLRCRSDGQDRLERTFQIWPTTKRNVSACRSRVQSLISSHRSGEVEFHVRPPTVPERDCCRRLQKLRHAKTTATLIDAGGTGSNRKRDSNPCFFRVREPKPATLCTGTYSKIRVLGIRHLQ
jgi:hypothetical protein